MAKMSGIPHEPQSLLYLSRYHKEQSVSPVQEDSSESEEATSSQPQFGSELWFEEWKERRKHYGLPFCLQLIEINIKL